MREVDAARASSAAAQPRSSVVDRVGVDLGARHRSPGQDDAGGCPAARARSRRRRRSCRGSARAGPRPATTSENEHARDVAGRAAEVDPGAARRRGRRRDRPPEPPAPRRRTSVSSPSICAGTRRITPPGSSGNRPLPAVGAARTRAPSSPPNTFDSPRRRLRRAEDDVAGRARRLDQPVVGARVVGRLGELDVVDDHRAARRARPSRSRRRRGCARTASARRTRRTSCRRSRRGDVVRRRLLPAQLEARVDGARARAASRDAGEREHARDRRRGERHGASMRTRSARVMRRRRRPGRRARARWKLWSTASISMPGAGRRA